MPAAMDLELGVREKGVNVGLVTLGSCTFGSNSLGTTLGKSTTAATGIVREVTITTSNERRLSRRLSALSVNRIWDGGAQIWDGGAGNSWVSIGRERRSSSRT